jgi:hypothetical protein
MLWLAVNKSPSSVLLRLLANLMFPLYALALPLLPKAAPNLTSLFVSDDTMAATDACDNIHDCRTTKDILYSCIAVVLACTWVSIHPNIPRLFDSGEPKPEENRTYVKDPFRLNNVSVLLQQAWIMLVAFTFPEFIVLWAMRENYDVSLIVRDYEGV